ncbi:hypothetical protein PILCRDRAFT_10882 [Piloderma croceum F 1598]|uniref:Uncharacterized protein n=1 Tax=Piloderma croceum (strain F 1598) TaxID=765440 RepID=A0A0C3F2C8_PILCF|nr:hypothetical protein PILCRDRAFT_10882 [Piloderma croceum F 1598]
MSSVDKHNLVLAVAIALVGVTLLVVVPLGLYCHQRYRRRQQTIPPFEHLEAQSKERHPSMMYQSIPLPKLKLDDMGTVFNPISIGFNGTIGTPPSLHLNEGYTLPTSIATAPCSGRHDAIHLAVEGNSDQPTRTRGGILAFPLPTTATDIHLYLENQKRFRVPTQTSLVSRQVVPIPTNTSGIPNATIMSTPRFCDTRSTRSLQIAPRSDLDLSQTRNKISTSQTFPLYSSIVATALKAPVSYATTGSASDTPDSTIVSSLSVVKLQSLVRKSPLASIHAAEGSKETRPTTHSYRAWLTNLPQPTWTTLEPQVTPGKEVKTVTQHKRKNPLSNKVVLDNDQEESCQEHGGQPHGDESSTGVDKQNTISPPQPQQLDTKCDKPSVPQVDIGEKPPNTSTTATPAIPSKFQFQSFESLYLHNVQGCFVPSTKIGDKCKEQHAPVFSFSFDTEGPNLDFHLNFGVKEGSEITTIPSGKRDAGKHSKPPKFFETLACASPSTLAVQSGLDEKGPKLSGPIAFSPPPTKSEREENLEAATVYTPKTHTPRVPSHSSSGSSSASILSWVPIRDPLTPRFNHLRAVLEGNTKGLDEASLQWPPGVKIVPGG